jgi:hypothetical protein
MSEHTHRRRWLWGLIPATIVVVLVLAYVFLDVIVTYATQKGLDRVEGASGSFKSLHVTVFRPGYDIYGLKVTQMPAGPKSEPLFYAEKIEMRWSWRELIKGKLVRRVKVFRGRAMIPMRPGDADKPAQPPLEIAKTLESVPSASLERLALIDSEVVFVDEHHAGQRLWLHDFDATIENMASRKDLMKGLPLLVTIEGKVQKTGALRVFLTIDPFDKGITFAGSAEVRHLEMSDLEQFTKIKGLSISKGTIDVFASLTCKRGQLNGGVKPIMKNLDFKGEGGFRNRVKAALADVAVKILSDDVPGRDAVATVIPIRGSLSNPKFQLVPAIMAVLRNAFVEGLSASLAGTPPAVAKEKEGVLHQMVDALSEDKKQGEAVKAQPEEK